MTDRIVVVAGNPVDGFQFYGPVTPNTPELDEFVDIHLRGVDWWYCNLQPIDTPDTAGERADREYQEALAAAGLVDPLDKTDALALIDAAAQLDDNDQPADRVRDLMADLEASIRAAKEARTRHPQQPSTD